jgi:hypothetical protein
VVIVIVNDQAGAKTNNLALQTHWHDQAKQQPNASSIIGSWQETLDQEHREKIKGSWLT